MNWLKEFIEDNKHVYKTKGAYVLVEVYAKLGFYLVLVPFINIAIIVKIPIMGILLTPITYLSYVVALQGQSGVMRLSLKLMNIKNKVISWFKR